MNIPVQFVVSVQRAAKGQKLRRETLIAIGGWKPRRYHDLWQMPVAELARRLRERTDAG